MPAGIIRLLVTVLSTGALVALINQVFLLPKTIAEARKINAETHQILKASDDLDEAVKARDPRLPNGWFAFGDSFIDYEMGVDDQTQYHGKASGYIKSRRPPRGFGSLTQVFKSDKYRGARLQVTAFVKTANVQGWAGLWMRVDGAEKTIVIDNMQDRPIRATTGWTKYAVVLDVARDSRNIAFGVLLDGTGQAWIADIEFKVVGKETPLTGASPAYPDEPTNLDFRT
ncbi:hypothetical protein [Bradyrhizobium iriomotense]|uniref:Uncharacterized protein n=1 Tax=Bradyrhizobium iriomotense TaxID=441950 RepID=A0ABQ6B6Q5_9BRAD|nr:hypothetical protein [Bradyrhizobium iriomotense]GLR90099.1 hypothetical protein GCM10007857_68130 [Bradyrhizobium iriomotense]